MSLQLLRFISIVATSTLLAVPGETRIEKKNMPSAKRASGLAAAGEHIEQIEKGCQTYDIDMGGKLDSFNTAYYPSSYGPEQRRKTCKFQPNEYVAMENIGDTPVINPRIVVNGRRDWFSAGTILAGILQDDMSDREKALAIWSFTSDINVQAHNNNMRVGPEASDAAIVGKNERKMMPWPPSKNTFKEHANPVKAANIYYPTGCQVAGSNFAVLCRAAGLPARSVWMCPLDTYRIHSVAEVWYDGDWHLFDPDRRAFFLEEDNLTVASYKDVHNNPELSERTHVGGFASKGYKSHADDYKKFYPPHEMPVEKWLSSMSMTLRPGEQFIWRWGHEGKFRWYGNVRQQRGDGVKPYRLANGKMIYHPCLVLPGFRRDIVAGLNVESVTDGAGKAEIRPVVAGTSSYIIYKIETPYPVVGGVVGATFHRGTKNDSCSIELSVANSNWIEVWAAGTNQGNFETSVAIDDVINPGGTPAKYEYYVKYQFKAAKSPDNMVVKGAYIETDVQMQTGSLPALSAGKNKVEYRDDTQGPRNIKVVHGWKESSRNSPPTTPAKAEQPVSGEVVQENALKKLVWEPANDPDGKGIKDYHIQVSPRADMLYPVSTNFDRITYSNKNNWSVPQGWLRENATYFWRVRARDKSGTWSDWSDVWRFQTK